MCTVCGVRPRAMPRVDFCFTCWPGGPVTPPPCLRCGSRRLYYASGLCVRCHPSAIPPPDACTNCLAWGATRHGAWRCKACATWMATYTQSAACGVCAHVSVLNEEGVCRLCCKQATLARARDKRAGWREVRRQGQQLFIANLFSSRYRGAPIPDRRRPRPTALAPPAHHQPVLFETARTLTHRGGWRGLAKRADPQLAAWVDTFTRRRKTRYGWSKELTWRARTGTHLILGFLDAPGARPTAEDLHVLRQAGLPYAHVSAILEDAGLLTGERTPALTRWAHQLTAPLPEAMAREVQACFTVWHQGSTTPPRSRPRSETTIRLYLGWVLPALTCWAGEGKTSLREITTADIRRTLPPASAARSNMVQGLHALFRFLKAHRLTFTDPARDFPVKRPDQPLPMPLDTTPIRDALHSTDPARALLCALLAFHALTSRQVRHLTLTDVDTAVGTVTVGERTIPLAGAVLDRLTAYLDHRRRRWPTTSNPHLFVNLRTATGTTHVGPRWLNLHLGEHLTSRSLRSDRVLDEVHAAGGDAKRLAILFGLSVNAANRYTATLHHPHLRAQPP